MSTILITHGVPSAGFAALAGHRVIIPKQLHAFSEEELLQHIAHADAVVACGKLPGHIIRAGKQLKIIANYGAGYDGVDVRMAAEAGIFVTNIPATVTQSTAELAVGLMLCVSRRIGELNLQLRNSAPEALFGMGLHMGRCLHGQTLGVIGCGRIGRRTAQLAQALGMRVIGFDPSCCADDIECVPLSLLLQTADIISLHCPLTDETRNLINHAAFTQMKRGAILINTARGPIVNYDDLAAALSSGHLAGAGLDVYPDEPHIPSSLLRLPNAVCTPHVGANTEQTRFEMAQACTQQILDVFNGKRPQNIVNGL